jgi:hypothetical protein
MTQPGHSPRSRTDGPDDPTLHSMVEPSGASILYVAPRQVLRVPGT